MEIIRVKMHDEIAPIMHSLFIGISFFLISDIPTLESTNKLMSIISIFIYIRDIYYFFIKKNQFGELYFNLYLISYIVCICMYVYSLYSYVIYFDIYYFQFKIIAIFIFCLFVYSFYRKLHVNSINLKLLTKTGKIDINENRYYLGPYFIQSSENQNKQVYNVVPLVLVGSAIVNSRFFQHLFNPYYFKLIMCSFLFPFATLVLFIQVFDAVFYYYVVKPKYLRKDFFS